MSLDSQVTSATIYKGLFTDDEWTIIDRALSEYQDHFDGDDTYEEIVYNRVVDKIGAIYRLTENNWCKSLSFFFMENGSVLMVIKCMTF